VSDLTFFPDEHLDRAVGLIFELASQLHVERERRAALEEALVRRGLIDRDELEALTDDPEFAADVRSQLDESISALIGNVTEDGPPQHPLRDLAQGAHDRQ
jgi:hypothetical protein